MIPVQRQAKLLQVGDRIQMEIGTGDFREVGWWTVHTLERKEDGAWLTVVVDGNMEFLYDDLVTVLVRPTAPVRNADEPLDVPTTELRND